MTRITKRQFHGWLGGAAASLAVPSVWAQAPRSVMADLAGYTGADRTQRLVDGARKEGPLSIYTSAQSDDMGAVVAGFEKKYGLKVTMWRAGSEKVLQRAITEARGNRHTVDIVETNGPELESMHREKIFQAVKSPVLSQITPQALRPHGEWVGTRLNVFVQAYNTNLVKKDEAPKTWEDLLHPRWKGRLGIEAEDQDWLAGVVGEIGEARGVKLFKDIVAANGMSVRKGHTLLTQLVVSGEIPFALTVYSYKAQQLKEKGAPIEWLSIGTPIARPNGIGVARMAPNPHSALLFFDYELGEEGQRILAGRDFVPTNGKVESPFGKGALKYVDARMMLDEYEKWTKLYEEIFTSKAR
ncbi:MAG TPA: extracellular solute-binding protein [Burkholderiaceae bacterium]|nr:extracellular solute-binding protein [Burkholderiaceae bacterium]